MRTALGLLLLLSGAAAYGCYTGPDAGADGNAPVTATAPSSPAAEGDLPCDIAELLATSCSSCHGEPLSGGAKNRLLDRADLSAPSNVDPSKTAADDCVVRMKNAADPMPPSGLLPAESVAAIERWIASGMPKGNCNGASSTSQETVCTSNLHWTRGDHGSSSMHPGMACIDCHQSTDEDDAPAYRIAGTVYPTAHEPDDCYGASGNISVVITDANGQSYSLPVNSAGNFYTRSRIATPYRAKIIEGDKTRAMETPQTNGDCNACHTEQGKEKAPGRIVAP